MTTYKVTVRGPVPPDLSRKLAEAHAAALLIATNKRRGTPTRVPPLEPVATERR